MPQAVKTIAVDHRAHDTEALDEDDKYCMCVHVTPAGQLYYFAVIPGLRLSIY